MSCDCVTMKSSIENCCIVCQSVFCCANCRWNHEKSTHGLLFDCPICRGHRYLCKSEDLTQSFKEHLFEEHFPLQCKKCYKVFSTMEDLLDIETCVSISELLKDNGASNMQIKEVEDKFDSIYEKITNNNSGDNIEGIISVNKQSKTAVITPIVRKKHLVDYESSDSDDDVKAGLQTPHPKLVSKTPKLKRQRAATPHAKKILSLMRQKVVEEYEETLDGVYDGSPITKTTPSRNEEQVPGLQKEMTTPTSHLPHLIKIAQMVTTSTPTHPVSGGWSLFPGQGGDSPLSEIENSESPAQSIGNEPSKGESVEVIPPKLKGIMTASRLRLGSQDSSEKQVTFQDSANATEASSIKTKKVQFAQDTVFEQVKVKRVFRKPRRMLTPGPQKPKYCFNPRFQALINRFESQGMIMARTPVTNREKPQETTPPVGEHSNMPARAINFRDDSPIIETEYSKESNELFKTCLDSTEVGMNNAITALTANIAGSLQNCLSSVLTTQEEDTEIQFKFVITKKKVSVKRIVEDGEGMDESSAVIERDGVSNKENIWSSVAKAVRNVFWGDRMSNFSATTPHRSIDSPNSTSSSASKRKSDDMSDCDLSPLNHKRYKYDGKIRGRPPLRRCKTLGVSGLRSFESAGQHAMARVMTQSQEEAMNLSF